MSNIKSLNKAITASLLIVGLLAFTGCKAVTLKSSLENSKFDTIRKASYFKGRDSSLTVEEFDKYRDLIITAINGANSLENVTIEKIGNRERLVISPYMLWIADTSPDVTIYIDGAKADYSREAGTPIIVAPGVHEVTYELKTPYFVDRKIKTFNFQSTDNLVIHDTTGWNFRTLTINNDREKTLLYINDVMVQEMTPGLNKLEYVPAVPLNLKAVSVSDPAYTSEFTTADLGINAVDLKLTIRTEPQTQVTNVTKIATITKPAASTNGGSATAAPDTSTPDTAAPDTAAPDTAAPDTAAPDTAAPDTAPPVTATAAATTAAAASTSTQGTASPAETIKMAFNLLQTNYIADLNSGKYDRLKSIIKDGSALNAQYTNEVKIAKSAGNSYTFLGGDSEAVTITSENSGYFETNTKYQVTKPDGSYIQPYVRYRYYFELVNSNVLFTAEEVIN